MRWTSIVVIAGLAVWPLSARAVTPDNFLLRTTADLVELCSASETDPLRVAAIHFCEGYMVGAGQYHQAEHPAAQAASDPPLYCMPNPAPSRDEIVRMFVAWARSHPQYMNERPIDSLLRFAAMTWPCRR